MLCTKGEADVVLKKLMTAASAVALIAAPTVATAQTASSAPAAMEPAGESVEGSEQRGRGRFGGWFVPLVVVIVIILGIIIFVQDNDEDGPPTSP
jgi:hypothetical protein